MSKNNRIVTILFLGILGFFLFLASHPIQTDQEEVIKKMMDEYIKIAKKIYDPETKPQTMEDIRAVESLRKQAAVFWERRVVRVSTITKDFRFLQNNVAFPYSIKNLDLAEDFAKLIVHFELDPANKNKYVSREGQYSLVLSGEEWKLSKFETPKKEPVYPVPEGSSPKELLTAYFKKMQTFFVQDSEDKQQKTLSMVSIRTETSSFWKLAERDIQLPSMQSAMFFNTYHPSAWDFQDIRESGDFSRVTVKMTAGNPLQLRLHKGPFDRSVQYSLIREDGNWFITGFKILENEK